MQIVDLERDGVWTASGFIDWQYLEAAYVCAKCGGPMLHRQRQDVETGVWHDWAQCGDEECGNRTEIMRQMTYDIEVARAVTVWRRLPPELQALYEGPEPPCRDAQTAILELFDY